MSWWTGDGHARDIISRNHATRQGAVTFVPGVVSHAFSLDGSSSFVSVSNRPNLNPGAANFTVGFWMKTASTGRLRALLNKREDCGGVRSFWDIRLSADGHIEVELTANGVLYGIIDTTTVNDGSWHHIALARQGTTVTLYIDGQTRGAVDTKSVLSIVNTAPILFGSHPCIGTDPTQFYQGLIDEVEWFNRALSSAEVQSLFNAGESGMCKP